MKTSAYAWRLAALLLLTLAARTALADTGYAYAWISDGSTATVSAQYSLNPGGGAVTASRSSAGVYTVVFPNSEIGFEWAVQATAYGANSNYCNVAAWGGSEVTVDCYNASGAAADSPFTVLAVSTTNDKDIAFAWANQSTTASYTPNTLYSYNPGGAISVTRSNPGLYSVTFNGLNGSGGTVQVDAYNSNATCYSNGWGGAFTAGVNCVDTSGNAVDSQFVIFIVPAGVSPTGLAFAWADGPSVANYTPSTEYSYNPTGGGVNITRSSTGQYIVTFSGLNAALLSGGNIRATSYGSAARCSVWTWARGAGNTLEVGVDCYNLTGGAVDSEYEVLALPPMGYAYAYIDDGTAASVSSTFSVNPGGAPVTAVHNGTGSYTVTFPNSGIGDGWTVQAIAYGGTADFCASGGWGNSSLDVLCYDTTGAAADSEFTVSAVSTTNGQNIAFAWADQPTTASYTPDTAYSYNPAGTIAVTRNATGNYAVVFNGLNSGGGTVQVTAYAAGGINCYSDGWTGANFTATVQCQNAGGTATDSDFVIAVIPAGATPTQVAFAWADQPSTANYTPNTTYSYNPGGAVSVNRSGAGQYAMTFSGLNAAQVTGGDVRVTAYQETTRCKVTSWGSTTVNLVAYVACYDPSGALTDAEYQVLVFAPAIGSTAAITASSGSPQSTFATTAFATALSAKVTDGNGNPISGVTVTFTAPSSGASGTFPGSSLTATATTNASGVATAPTFTANSTAGGPYEVKALVLGVSGTANFTLTNTALTSVTLTTSPGGLLVSLDGGPFVAAPYIVNLVPASIHTIATETPQAGAAGVQYAWQSWSDGGTLSHNISVPGSTWTFTATFQTQYQLTVSGSPVAGGSVTPASGAFYNAGTVVPVTALANSGYSFSSWLGPVASSSSASTTVTMSAAEIVTANFSSLTGITIQTNPPGLQVSVDGVTYTAPQTLNLPVGPHTIAVVTTQGGGGTQDVFSGWSDGGAASHSIAVTGSPATYTATFTVQYLLTTGVSPSGSGSVAANPASAGYYTAGTSVQLTASPGAGYQFSNWSGDVSGSANPQSITMNAPHSVTANFSTVVSSCSFVLGPSSASLPATGTSTVETCPNGSGQPNCGVLPETARTFTVTPSAACGAWTATSSNPGILQVTSGAAGSGSGAVGYTLLTNTHTTPQTYTILVEGGGTSATYTITEAGSGDNEVYRQVYALYEQLLGRDPDSGGFAFWTGTGGAGLGQMADAFLTSPEAFNSDFVVMATYQAATGAPPSFAQYSSTVVGIREGTLTVTGLFNSLTPGGYSATTLYQNLLNRLPSATEINDADSAGLASWFQTLIGYPNSTTPVNTPNNEFQSTGIYNTGLSADHTNALYVRMLYFVILGRDPDPSGFSFWVGVANTGGPGVLFSGSAGVGTRIQILGPGTAGQGFIGSSEFQNLFAN